MTNHEKELINYAAEAFAQAQMRYSQFPLDGPERISSGISHSVQSSMEFSTSRYLDFMREQEKANTDLKIRLFIETQRQETRRTFLTLIVSFFTAALTSTAAALITVFLSK